MKQYIKADPWCIIEDRYDAHLQMNTESLMSLGNGRMGQRANQDETYSGPTLKGSYIAGVYYPDETKVGWWKNGYPKYFAKVLNALDWTSLKVVVDDEEIDLAKSTILNYNRVLDMQKGILERDVTIQLNNGKKIRLLSERFYSIVDTEKCFLKYAILALDSQIRVSITSGLDFNVRNQDSNHKRDFWKNRQVGHQGDVIWSEATTDITGFLVCGALKQWCHTGNAHLNVEKIESDQGYIGQTFTSNVGVGTKVELVKSVAITSTFYHDRNETRDKAINQVHQLEVGSYTTHHDQHRAAWRHRWQASDLRIEGDDKAQQGIRFNIFHLYQTYTGADARLNIGPKGFTGEKYGGSTYWDTEAYCLPFYLCTSPKGVSHQLLKYRYHHLEKAIENAGKLGFTKGAALYPMVTMTGEECHNEWEITFEEIHRNGAIAYAIYHYTRYTGDLSYIPEYGLEVLVGIARFWSQRVHVSPSLDMYVMLGVTGPNEYENNVDNNWYTNYIARWCLSYTAEQITYVKSAHPDQWARIATKVKWQDEEAEKWQDIIERMYLPFDAEKQIFLQQDGYLNKEDILISDLRPEDRPLNQKWSWDRILRSPFIKQADVLQGMYLFRENFSDKVLKRHFLFYEPRTVHESSLSPCIHAILAAQLGLKEKAYEMYLRTARLDLDDYNNDTEDGCHITSMAGTWMSIVEGFAGMKVKGDRLAFDPYLPDQWTSYCFKINHRDHLYELDIKSTSVTVRHLSEGSGCLEIFGQEVDLPSHTEKVIKL